MDSSNTHARTRALAGAGTSAHAGPAARVGTPPHASLAPHVNPAAGAGRRARYVAIAALGAYLLVYLSWQLWHWLPGRQQFGQALLPPADAMALCATLLAARRCAGAPRVRSFWLVMSGAITAQLVADVLLLRNVIVHVVPPFPTLADPFFLTFYVLLFAALLRVPVAPMSAARRTRMAIDGATIVIGGGAVVWYVVLGPTATASGQSALAMAVSVAYPMGDLILLGGLAVVLLRKSPAMLRWPLLLIAGGMVASIVGDMVYGYGVLHGTYTNGDPIDTAYVVEFLLFAAAAIVQVPVPVYRGDPQAQAQTQAQTNTQTQAQAQTREWSEPASRASWLPYLSVATALGILLGVELKHPFFPDTSLVLIVIALTALVSVRQYLAQRELLRTQAQLRESERVKDEFLSIASHELRTPLTAICGSLGLLEAGVLGELPEDAANMVAIASVNTDRLVRLVGDVLDMERMAAGRLELAPVGVEARELVEQSLTVVQANADSAGVELRCEVPPRERGSRPITVWADPDRVVQVLVNLLGNAIKFSSRGDRVTVTVSHDEDGALFSVRDTGRGIPADRLESVFDRFRQVDASDAREKGGTGLGLPIARAIVEQHGGRMWVRSSEGEGSTFCFTLPVADLAPAPPLSPDRAPAPSRAPDREPVGGAA